MKTKTTKTILGYKLSLNSGARYLAVRPFVGRGFRKDSGERFPVMIVDATNPTGDRVAYVDDMTYQSANRFLDAFNGQKSFEGRVW